MFLNLATNFQVQALPTKNVSYNAGAQNAVAFKGFFDRFDSSDSHTKMQSIYDMFYPPEIRNDQLFLEIVKRIEYLTNVCDSSILNLNDPANIAIRDKEVIAYMKKFCEVSPASDIRTEIKIMNLGARFADLWNDEHKDTSPKSGIYYEDVVPLGDPFLDDDICYALTTKARDYLLDSGLVEPSWRYALPYLANKEYSAEIDEFFKLFHEDIEGIKKSHLLTIKNIDAFPESQLPTVFTSMCFNRIKADRETMGRVSSPAIEVFILTNHLKNAFMLLETYMKKKKHQSFCLPNVVSDIKESKQLLGTVSAMTDECCYIIKNGEFSFTDKAVGQKHINFAKEVIKIASTVDELKPIIAQYK